MGCTCSTTNIFVLQQNDKDIICCKTINFNFVSGDTMSFISHLQNNTSPKIFWNFVTMKTKSSKDIYCRTPISSIRDSPNVGGFSQNSEFTSSLIIEHLLIYSKMKINNVVPEGLIEYRNFYDGSKKIKDSRKTDYLCVLNTGYKIAVEVKRIHKNRYDLRERDREHWPPSGMINCLIKADKSAKESNERVCDEYKWDYHMLHFIVNINDIYGFYEVLNDYYYRTPSFIKNFDSVMISYITSKDDWVFYDDAEIERFS
jgi:hypothetical protein